MSVYVSKGVRCFKTPLYKVYVSIGVSNIFSLTLTWSFGNNAKRGNECLKDLMQN